MEDMTEPKDAFCNVYVPSLGERIGRFLGFRHRHPDVDLSPGVAIMPGWARTTVRIDVSFGDRLRLLLTGKARMDLEHRMSAPVDEMISDSAFSVVWPFGDAQ